MAKNDWRVERKMYLDSWHDGGRNSSWYMSFRKEIRE